MGFKSFLEEIGLKTVNYSSPKGSVRTYVESCCKYKRLSYAMPFLFT